VAFRAENADEGHYNGGGGGGRHVRIRRGLRGDIEREVRDAREIGNGNGEED
jgi:hypothetical protein